MKRGFVYSVISITVLVYLASSLPYLAGYRYQTPDSQFTGIVFDVPDTAQYYAWMRAFAHRPLIANPLTPEPGVERFFNLQWWLLGMLAFDTPLGPNVTYQLLRLIALVAFAGTLAAFCTLAVRRERTLAFLLVMVSSGFGWLLVLAKQRSGELSNPLSVQIAEANTFFSAMAFPHLLVAGALLLGIFGAFLRAAAVGPRAGWRWLALLAVLTLALGFSHGYDLIPAMVIPGVTALVALLVRFRQDMRLAAPAGRMGVGTIFAWLRQPHPWSLIVPIVVLVASAGPPALYVLALTRLDATWRGVLGQYGNAGVFTPPPPQLLILLGLPLLLACWQLRPAAWAALALPQLFLRIWFVVGFALIYVPTNYQIKMLTTYQVPVCLLAAQTLQAMYRWFNARYERVGDGGSAGRRAAALLVAVVAVVMLTNVYLTAWRVIDLRRTQYPYYLSGDDLRALEMVGRVTAPGDVVLSSTELGLFVPVYSDARPFVAHWAQSLDFYARREIAAQVYDETTPEGARRALVTANQIDFVLAGPAEWTLGGGSPTSFGWERLGGACLDCPRGTVLYRTTPVAIAGGR